MLIPSMYIVAANVEIKLQAMNALQVMDRYQKEVIQVST